MIKNKFKLLICLVISIFFGLFFSHKICAYNASVTSIEGLVYGNALKAGTIRGNSDVNGTFTFTYPNNRLETYGDTQVSITFTPSDESLDSMVILFNANVSKRRVYPVFSTLIYKRYDGKDGVTLPEYTFQGIINDEITIEGTLEARVITTFPAENTPLILSGISLNGDKKDYYYLDLENYSAIIYPTTLEKSGADATKIILSDDVIVDVNYFLSVEKTEERKNINDAYTSFLTYSYKAYTHAGEQIPLGNNIKVEMVLGESIINTHRLKVFKKVDDKYVELEYRYENNKIYFTIDGDSEIVFATKNIDYQLIIVFSGILLFSFAFMGVYYLKNSKIKVEKKKR